MSKPCHCIFVHLFRHILFYNFDRSDARIELQNETVSREPLCYRPLCFHKYHFEGMMILKSDLLRYSMQIAMLRQLLALSLISQHEFILIKNRTMREYGILSDLTS